jgi:UDP-glucose 4-epimerase
LVSRGEDVTILDNLSTGAQKNISHLEGKIRIFHGDIRDKGLVEDLVEKNDLILHMAAALGVSNILENPIESISTNFYGSHTVLNAAQRFNKRIVIASTSEVYGKNTKQPLSETDDRVIGTPQKLRWSYSDAKSLEEGVAHAMYLIDNLRVTTVRLFNTVGPRQSGKYGMVIPRFVNSALKNNQIHIFGNGTQTRVFCHVSDTIEAILSLASNPKCIGQVFNIGGVEEISILDLAKKITSQLNSKSEIKFLKYELAYPSGFEDMQRRVPDISKIKDWINWEPKKNLSTIINDISNYNS